MVCVPGPAGDTGYQGTPGLPGDTGIMGSPGQPGFRGQTLPGDSPPEVFRFP